VRRHTPSRITPQRAGRAAAQLVTRDEARRIAANITKLPGLVLRPQYEATFGLSITFECSLCRSLLRLITRSEAIVRAARLELAVAIFIPRPALARIISVANLRYLVTMLG
jgi:hypothetical protein